MFQEVLDYVGVWRGRVLPYDRPAEQYYRSFPARLRQELGNDARIAAIAPAYSAGVWTCNVNDFKRVPGLAVYDAETGARLP